MSFFLVVEWGLSSCGHGLSRPAARGSAVPRPGIKPASPALEDRFLTTGPPAKSLRLKLWGSTLHILLEEIFHNFFQQVWLSLFLSAPYNLMWTPKWSEVKVKVAKLCPTLCDPLNYSVHGILQGRILQWVAVPISRGSFQPRDQTQVSCVAGGFFTVWATRKAQEYWSE